MEVSVLTEKNDSDRIVDVDEAMFQVKPACEFIAQRHDPEPLRGVVAGSEVGDIQFPRQVQGLLGDLAADEGVVTGIGGL